MGLARADAADAAGCDVARAGHVRLAAGRRRRRVRCLRGDRRLPEPTSAATATACAERCCERWSPACTWRSRRRGWPGGCRWDWRPGGGAAAADWRCRDTATSPAGSSTGSPPGSESGGSRRPRVTAALASSAVGPTTAGTSRSRAAPPAARACLWRWRSTAAAASCCAAGSGQSCRRWWCALRIGLGAAVGLRGPGIPAHRSAGGGRGCWSRCWRSPHGSARSRRPARWPRSMRAPRRSPPGRASLRALRGLRLLDARQEERMRLPPRSRQPPARGRSSSTSGGSFPTSGRTAGWPAGSLGLVGFGVVTAAAGAVAAGDPDRHRARRQAAAGRCCRGWTGSARYAAAGARRGRPGC